VRSGKYSKSACFAGSSVAGATAAASSSVMADLTTQHKTRTCKWKSCSECDISSTSKYVVVRCNAGCISNMHPACFQLLISESQLQSKSAEITCALPGDTPELGSVSCPRVHDDKPCGHVLSKAVMKQQHKVITFLIPVRDAHVDACASDSDNDVDTEESEDNDDEDADTNSGAWAGRRRGARKGASLAGFKTSKLKRMRTLEDGTVIFEDELERLEHAAIKAEKKRLTEEKEKQKIHAETTRRTQSNASSSATSNGSISNFPPSLSSFAAGSVTETPKKKPFTFEVVVPFPERMPTTNGGAKESVAQESTPAKLPISSTVSAASVALAKHKKEDVLKVGAASRARISNKTTVSGNVAFHTPGKSSYVIAAQALGSTTGAIATVATGLDEQIKSNSIPGLERQKECSVKSNVDVLLSVEHAPTEVVLRSAKRKSKKSSRRQSRAAASIVVSAKTVVSAATEQQHLRQEVYQLTEEQKVKELVESFKEQKLDVEYKMEQKLDTMFEQDILAASLVSTEQNYLPCVEVGSAASDSRSETPLSMDAIFSSRRSSQTTACDAYDEDIVLIHPRTALTPTTTQLNSLLHEKSSFYPRTVSKASSFTINDASISSSSVPAPAPFYPLTTASSAASSSLTSTAVNRAFFIPSVTMWQDVLASPGNVPSTVILLRSVPFGLTCEALGSLFASLGRVSVNLVYTAAYGCVATLTFEDVYTTAMVMNLLYGREVELRTEQSHTLSSCVPFMSRWRMDNMVFGLWPVSVVPLPQMRWI
jgi:hypothetical protein